MKKSTTIGCTYRTDFNQAIQLDPKYVPAYNNRGHAYYERRTTT
jgi:TPR repeat